MFGRVPQNIVAQEVEDTIRNKRTIHVQITDMLLLIIVMKKIAFFLGYCKVTVITIGAQTFSMEI